jgi:hypothetical protein
MVVSNSFRAVLVGVRPSIGRDSRLFQALPIRISFRRQKNLRSMRNLDMADDPGGPEVGLPSGGITSSIATSGEFVA